MQERPVDEVFWTCVNYFTVLLEWGSRIVMGRQQGISGPQGKRLTEQARSGKTVIIHTYEVECRPPSKGPNNLQYGDDPFPSGTTRDWIADIHSLDLSVLSRLSPTNRQLFQQAPLVGSAQVILVYSGRVFMDSDTESEGRDDQSEPADTDQQPQDAMGETV